MSHTRPIGTHPTAAHRPGDTIPFGSFERMITSDRGFEMVDPSGSVVFSPLPMGEEADYYDVGIPVAEINAGTSRFAVFSQGDEGFLLASAEKVATDDGKRDHYRVNMSSSWRVSEGPLYIGRADKPGEPDGTLSARHFKIQTDTNGRLVVTDTGSLNGTSTRLSPRSGALQMPERQDKNEVAAEFRHALGRAHSRKTERMIGAYPEALLPTRAVHVGERTFYLTDIIGPETHYPQAVMYTTEQIGRHPQMVSRLLYKSNSDGGWRVSYGVEGDGRYRKEGLEDERHYTQETKPVRHLLDALADQGGIPDHEGVLGSFITGEFSTAQPETIREQTASKEISYYHSPAIDAGLWQARALSAGQFGSLYEKKLQGLGYDTVSRYLAELDSVFVALPHFLPDFRYPARAVYQSEHTTLGSITIEEFSAKVEGRPVTWSMAHDDEGRVWVENVYFTDSGISSYGTRTEVLNMGSITSKPLDYPQQTGLLTAGEYEHNPHTSKYHDITPVLDNLLPIAYFREGREIERRRVEYDARVPDTL